MKCHICGEKATIKDVDPYFEELPELLEENSVNEEVWWCEKCYQKSLDDI